VDLASIVTSVVIAVTALFLVVYLLYRLARWARTRATGAYVLGALFAPLGAAGNVSDPDFRITDEAKQRREHEEDDPGDPPNETL
jgi:hypothetical protein